MGMFKWIKTIIENQRRTMNNAGEQCHKCNHYSYAIVAGGLHKIEHCRRYHKEYVDECPDFEPFCFSDWDNCIYHKGRYEH